MQIQFTSSDLRTAANQAVTLANLSFCGEARLAFLKAAVQLQVEADRLEMSGAEGRENMSSAKH
jgi:hypothetical protein